MAVKSSDVALGEARPARRRAPKKSSRSKPSTQDQTETLNRLTALNRRLTYVLLIAAAVLTYQGWRYTTARLHQSVLTQQRMAVLNSVVHKQKKFMRLHNRYAGALEVLRIPGATQEGVRARVVTYNTRDGPAFLAEACNAGGCTSIDHQGKLRTAVPLRYLVVPDSEVELTESPDTDQDSTVENDVTPADMEWDEP